MTVAAAVSAFSAIAFLNGGGSIQWKKLCPRNSLKFPINPCKFSSTNVRIQLRSSSSSSSGGIQSYDSENEVEPRTYTWPDKKRPRVCILGGGFGGLYTALRLESLVWPDEKKPQVALVDQSEHFVFKPMLYELLSGEVDPWEIAPRFSDLLANTSVQFFRDRVKCLYPSDHLGMIGSSVSGSGGTVHLESGLMIEYDCDFPDSLVIFSGLSRDAVFNFLMIGFQSKNQTLVLPNNQTRLVLALGAVAKLDIVPGAAEYALPFSTLEDACKVDEKLKALERQKFGKNSPIRVAVVGCGYSGVELAATISERLQDKGIVEAINVEKTVLPNAPTGNREAALKVLSSRKVKLLLGYFVRCIREVVKSEIHDMETAQIHRNLILELQPAERGVQSQILEADLVLWTVGSKPLLPLLEPFDKPHDIPLNARGQAETDETLRVKGHPRIFAVGDSSAFRDSSGKLLPATAQVAFQQADFAGWNLWAAINDRPLLPFRLDTQRLILCLQRFQNLGEMMTLGVNDAAISPSFIDGLTLEGPIGHTARKFAYLIRLPTDEHRVKVGISWLTKTVVDSVAFLQDNIAKVVSGS